MNAEGGGGPRAPSVRRIFREPQATEAVLDFLRDKGGKAAGTGLLRSHGG